MTINTLKLAVCAAALTVGFGLTTTTRANAQAAVMKECSTEFSAAKAAGTLGDKTWPGFLADCRVRKENPTPVAAPAPVKPLPPVVAAPVKPAPPIVAAPAPVAPAPKVTPPATPATLPPVVATTIPAEPNAKPRTPGQQAFYDRERKCGAYWKVNKVALKEQTPGLRWPQFLSSCNAQLKAANQ